MLIHDPAQLEMLPDLSHLRISSPTGPREPFVARQINPHSPDVVFSPMQTMGGAGRRYRLILTLHDLIYYEHRTPPPDLPLPVRLGWRLFHLSYAPQRFTLNRADAVATVSQTTRDLISRHHLTRRPVHLIPNAPQRVNAPRPPRQPPSKDLLYIGSFMEYKNVEALIEGINQLPEYTLHLCSPISPQRRAELAGRAERPGQLVFHNGVSDEEYAQLLHRVSALVTLSRAEGYGLPVIEAMSHGTPVIVSDLPIFGEVIGAATADLGAQVVDPSEPHQFAAAVRRLEPAGVFSSASAAARARSLHYSWEDSAGRLIQLAESLIR